MKQNWNSIRRWSWRAAKAVAIIAVVGGIVYWLKLAPIAVNEHTVGRGPIVAEVLGTGTLEARVKTTVSPKIAGRVKTVLVDQGDRVNGGQELVYLDDDELRQQVAIAQANLDAATAALVRLKTDKDRSQAVAVQASKRHSRVVRLLESNAVSQEDVDKAVEALAIADAGLSHAEAAITEGQKELIAAEKTSNITARVWQIRRSLRRSMALLYAATAILAMSSFLERPSSRWSRQTNCGSAHG